jgi:lysophospholipase L1-like esterase
MNASSGLLPGKVDVAMYKFCYIDSPGDAAALFNTAKSAMTLLQATYPDVTFVWWTMPIETTSNAGRQTYNDLVRSYCKANEQWLFDIAAIESHTGAGVLQLDGSNREILYSGYSADGGHPNDAGALKLAKAYWRLIAEIAKTR